MKIIILTVKCWYEKIFLQQHQQQWRSLREINYQMNNILITSAGKRVSLLNAFKKELKAVFS
jgi:hypothetical protein